MYTIVGDLLGIAVLIIGILCLRLPLDTLKKIKLVRQDVSSEKDARKMGKKASNY